MSLDRIHYTTFKQGSRTYFNSSLFFPKAVRQDVFALYGFVRVADNFVDSVPQDPGGFYRFKEAYEKARQDGPIGDPIIDAFVELGKRKSFDPDWTEAFLHSMELDLSKKEYNRLEETLEYIYGSAEVIGLYMAKVLNLAPESLPHAERLGRSMQYINFIRDIEEDRMLGRRYLPFLGDYELDSLGEEYTKTEPEKFEKFIRFHISLYEEWQREAREGFKYIPRRYLIPIRTASDMYYWTSRQITNSPFAVYGKKIKPSKGRIIMTALTNAFFSRREGA